MPTFSIRRVVTQVDGDGASFASDGPPPNLVAGGSGFGVAELLWLDGPPSAVDDGGDRTSPGYPLEPPPGGLSSRIIRMPAGGDWLRVEGDDDELPGMHATDTLDLMVVLSGAITLGLPDEELVVGAGDVVVQRGTPHRWRVHGDAPCTYWVTMLRPDATTDGPPGSQVLSGDSGQRRVVTGGTGAEVVEPPAAMRGDRFEMVDVWQTGGPLAASDQGGDVPPPWDLEPAGGGVAFRCFQLPPHDGGDEGWHTTATIDVDVVLSGRVALELPGGHRAELDAGDVVVQRGTDHRWVPIGEEPLRMAALMVAVR